ncbi:MAG: N-acetylglucosamine-6-phosphate deacetylase [Anaerolineaceae bacterium]
MHNKIIHADVCTPDQFLSDQTIEIMDGKFRLISPTTGDDASNISDCFNAQGLIVAPGLIDIHTHGGNGADAMDATPKALETISIFLSRHGITSFLATTVTSSSENINSALAEIRDCSTLPGAALLGAHVEGPYINIVQKGAQNPQFFRSPQSEEYHAWIETGVVKLITIAPELEGMDEFIRYCVEQKVELAIGHSSATYEQVIHAVDLGVHQATHLFNGMPGLHHREPGTVGGSLLDDRIFAQIIVDGIHLHPVIVKLIIALKGLDRTILISDAMRATGLSDGTYDLGGQDVSVLDGIARTASGSLAGSTLTLDKAIRNTMQFCGLDFQQTLPMATRVPAQAMHIADRKGVIEAGCDADLAFFDRTYQVVATMVSGVFVFQKNK